MKRISFLMLLVAPCASAGPKSFLKHFVPHTGPVADKKFWVVSGLVIAASFADGYSTQRCSVEGHATESRLGL
jgi:hypothetical protein